MSVSKNIAMASALIVEHQSRKTLNTSALTLDTPVRLVLPQFHLPERDWNDGGSEITMNMLASHTSGLPRESFSTEFNLILNKGKADLATIGAGWAGATPEGILEEVGRANLMFAPGERPACERAEYAVLCVC
jgi:CubicO group peptidase (beta-lactamase class C family)